MWQLESFERCHEVEVCKVDAHVQAPGVDMILLGNSLIMSNVAVSR